MWAILASLVCILVYVRGSCNDAPVIAALYTDTRAPRWTTSTGWQSSGAGYCSAFGIVCNGFSCITSLKLPSNNVTGTLPTLLGALSQLQELDLGGNGIGGTMPTQLGRLVRLTFLRLGPNGLNGTIPTEFGFLTALQNLNLPNSQLSGTIPSTIGNLNALQVMDLGSNRFIGTIPTALGRLVSVTILSLARNSFNGTIPIELGRMAGLTYLDLGSNSLTGTIPLGSSLLSKLALMRLNTNNFNGTIPTDIGKLIALTILDLSNNKLNGSLPSELSTLKKLTQLILSTNSLSGTLPTFFGSMPALVYLELGGNKLNGTLPTELVNMRSLQILRLASNSFNCTIPNWLGQMTNLTSLRFSSTIIQGTIPTELGNLTSLNSIEMSGNALIGTLPTELGNLRVLNTLGLGLNKLTGTIPTELGKLTSLQQLQLSDNRLTGTIPSELGRMSSLGTIELQSNFLSGTIPSTIANLTNLGSLSLGGTNQLEGSIPAGLGRTRLHYIKCDNQSLSGTLPSDLGLLTYLTSLLLGNNKLSGTIPTEWGRLTRMQYMNLSQNMLNGTIPEEFYNMTLFSSLALDSNQLCGTLPQVVKWPRSTVLRFQNNTLAGTLPPLYSNFTTLNITSNCLALTDASCNYTFLSAGVGLQASFACGCALCATGTIGDPTRCARATSGICSRPTAPVPQAAPVQTPLPPPAPEPEPIEERGGTLSIAGGAYVYTALSAPLLAVGGPGLVAAGEICSRYPGGNSYILMPFRITMPHGVAYNLFLHAGVIAVVIALSLWKARLGGLGWGVFQMMYFAVVVNVSAVVRSQSRGILEIGAAAVSSSAVLICLIMYLRRAQSWFKILEWTAIPAGHSRFGLSVWSVWQARVGDEEDNDLAEEEEFGSGDEDIEEDISEGESSEPWQYDKGSVGVEEEEDWEWAEHSFENEEAPQDIDEGNAIALSTTWCFMSHLPYFAFLRFGIVCAVPGVLVAVSPIHCTAMSAAYCSLVLGWCGWVVFTRPFCSDAGLLLEALNTLGVVSGLIPHVFGLEKTMFNLIATVVSCMQLIGNFTWAYVYRGLFRDIVGGHTDTE